MTKRNLSQECKVGLNIQKSFNRVHNINRPNTKTKPNQIIISIDEDKVTSLLPFMINTHTHTHTHRRTHTHTHDRLGREGLP